jgi:hypothetical protein
MSYHELRLQDEPKLTLDIKPGHINTSFDIDYFGQDDGTNPDPDASFRLIFQLGAGYMIYLYVIGMSKPGELSFFHTFWIKGCVAVEVEREEMGAPLSIDGGPHPLPVIYQRVSLFDSMAREEQYEVDTCRFEAKSKPKLSLQMFWNLYSLKTRKLATLLWTNAEGWGFTSQGKFHLLAKGDQVLFHAPNE